MKERSSHLTDFDFELKFSNSRNLYRTRGKERTKESTRREVYIVVGIYSTSFSPREKALKQ
jgi:hypothetical protein